VAKSIQNPFLKKSMNLRESARSGTGEDLTSLLKRFDQQNLEDSRNIEQSQHNQLDELE